MLLLTVSLEAVKVKMIFHGWIYVPLIVLIICVHCGSAVNACKIIEERADCSHLKLTQIPSDLPSNITALDISHNQLRTLPTANLTKYNQLIYLDAGFNTISKLQPELCLTLPLLKVLKLEHNQLHVFPSNVFTSCISLKELNLGSNILDVKNEPFKNLKNLQFLDVSHNKLSSIKLGSQPQLESLQELVASQNKITELKKEDLYFLSNSSLNKLDLSANPVKEFYSGCFRAIGNLYGLIMNKVPLGQDGTEKLASELSGTRIQHLSMSQVQLSQISSSTFNGMHNTNLTILDLSNNGLSVIENDSLVYLSNLEDLNLMNNNITRLFSHSLNGLSNVNYLNLGYSDIRKIDSAFQWLKHLKDLIMDGLRNLRLLDLESNGFDEVPRMAFQGLSQLRSLNLRVNNLNLLPEFVFDDLTSLTSLFLEKNLITAVDEKVFSKVFTHLKELNMGFNPFDCTCDGIAWFVNWLNGSKTFIPGLNNYRCNTPSKYHSNLVAQFDTSPCDSAPFELVYIVSTTSILFFISVVLLIHFQGWRIQFLWSVTVNRVLGHREIDRPQQWFDYDAYIIHSKKDKNWVSKNFISLEENNEPVIRFCLEERDFEAGTSEFEAVVDSIRRSRKIIFVVTEHLLKDPWCKRFKVHHAIQQAIEQSRDAIILIFRDDIPDYKLNNALCLRRAMFKSRCILEWPAQKDHLNAFYQQLKSALQSSSRIL
ncbi:toll-like receptor 3 isoform X3 [Sceloporus undulatus]|uniref:toll-like receptor 3 isoform X3 n=1 Tax=Sceloporus undulatus TaxID=8520 RepID=UPI001C4D389C|nr:toll-like receptor 3 isoform X3 [Sceloporus undulatus]